MVTNASSPAFRKAVEGEDPRRITLRQAIGFGIGDFYGGGQLVIAATYIPLFWTRFCSMSVAVAQGIIGLSAIASAIAALIFGVLDDNMYRYRVGRRFGRRRLFLALLSPLLLIGILLWIPGQPLAVYVAAYLAWVILAQVFQACYNPLPGEMTQDFDGRTKLSTVRLFISTAAGTVIPLVGSVVLARFGEYVPYGYTILGIVFTVLFALAVAAAWRFTWELTPEQAGFARYERNETVARRLGIAGWARRAVLVLREYASTLRIALFRRHLVVYLLVQMSMDVFGQTFVFFVVYDWNRTAAFASLLLSCSLVSLPLMPIFGWLMTAIGPKRLYSINFAGCLIGIMWLFSAWMLVGVIPGAWWTVFVVIGSIWFFSFKSLCGYLPWAVFPYIADVDQIVTKRYRSATFSGLQASLRQLGSGVATISVGVILGSVGFDSTLTSQTPRASLGLGAVLLGGFAMAMIICWFVSTRIHIDRHTDAIVLAEISRLRSGGRKSDVTVETKSVIEELSGVAYDECWK